MSGIISSENINTLTNADIDNIISYHKDISSLINNSYEHSLANSTSVFFRRFKHGCKVVWHRLSNIIFHDYPNATKEPVWINNSKITNILISELSEIKNLKDKDNSVIRKITNVVKAALDCRDLASPFLFETGFTAPFVDPEGSLKDPVPDLETVIPSLKIRRYSEDYSTFKTESDEQILHLQENINRINEEISDIDDLSSRCLSSTENGGLLVEIIQIKNTARKRVLQEKLENAQKFLSKKMLIAKVMELADFAKHIRSDRGDESYLEISLAQVLSRIGMPNWSDDYFKLNDSIKVLSAKFFSLSPSDPLPTNQMQVILDLLRKGLIDQNVISDGRHPVSEFMDKFRPMYDTVSDAVKNAIPR